MRGKEKVETVFQVDGYEFTFLGPEIVHPSRPNREPYLQWTVNVQTTSGHPFRIEGVHVNDGSYMGANLVSSLYRQISSGWLDQNYREVIRKTEELHEKFEAQEAEQPKIPPPPN